MIKDPFDATEEQLDQAEKDTEHYWQISPGMRRSNAMKKIRRTNIVSAINGAKTVEDIKAPLLAILAMTRESI